MNRKKIVITSLVILFSLLITVSIFILTNNSFRVLVSEPEKKKTYGEKADTARKKHTENREYITNFARLTAEFYDIGIHELWNMTGPFELLNENEFLLIAKCGEVFY
ncbi:MAG TPA: hypothetical protein VIH22_07300 [Cyclobacteriaceae bacterium]